MRLTLMAALAVTFAACASTSPPTRELVSARASINTAEAVDVDDPTVALHIQAAREQMAAAEVHVANGDNTAARRALERAEADADLAFVLAREARARAQAQAAMDEVERLQRAL